MSKGCGCCVDTRNARKDFRRDHGGGPEEMPHRKAGKKKGKNRKRADHKHLWESNAPLVFRFAGGSWAEYRLECLICGEKGNTLFEWNFKE